MSLLPLNKVKPPTYHVMSQGGNISLYQEESWEGGGIDTIHLFPNNVQMKKYKKRL